MRNLGLKELRAGLVEFTHAACRLEEQGKQLIEMVDVLDKRGVDSAEVAVLRANLAEARALLEDA